MAFRAELEAPKGYRLVRISPKYPKSGRTGHWIIGHPEKINTFQELYFLAVRGPGDFSSPAIIAIRTTPENNFVGWDVFESGEQVKIERPPITLTLTSL